MAHTLRGEVAQDLMFHADRGTQFTSDQLHQVCQKLGIDRSVDGTHGSVFRQCDSRILLVNTHDRVLQPSGITEPQRGPDRSSLRCIESFSNQSRRHSSIGNQSPVDFENAYHQAPTAATENAA